VRYPVLGIELARVLRLCGLAQLPPLLIALGGRDLTQAAIFAAIGIVAFVLGRLGSRSDGGDVRRGEALVLSALAYVVFAGAGALAFLPATSFLDGLFEAMSGYTTTGLSVLDVENLSPTLVLFRSYTQWVGGAGIVVLSLVLLDWPARTLFPTHAAELVDKGLAGSVRATSRLVLRVYLALTAACFLTYGLVGMSWFDAAAHALATVSTGGFSSHPDSIGHYRSAAVVAAVIVFMVLGAAPFPLHAQLWRRGPRALVTDPQLVCLLLLLALAAGAGMATDRGHGLLDHVFLAASAATTTGFETSASRSYGDTSQLLAMALMFIGGAAGSTAGGIKLFRFLVLGTFLRSLVVRPLLPDEATVPLRYGGTTVDDAVLRNVLGLVLLYLAFLAVSAAALTLAGIPPMDACFECVSALATVGLSCGVTDAHLGSWPKLVLLCDMWAGRLEILAVLVLLYPAFWRRAAPRPGA